MHTISERQREEKKNCPTFYEAAVTLITKPANVNSKDSFLFLDIYMTLQTKKKEYLLIGSNCVLKIIHHDQSEYFQGVTI